MQNWLLWARWVGKRLTPISEWRERACQRKLAKWNDGFPLPGPGHLSSLLSIRPSREWGRFYSTLRNHQRVSSNQPTLFFPVVNPYWDVIVLESGEFCDNCGWRVCVNLSGWFFKLKLIRCLWCSSLRLRFLISIGSYGIFWILICHGALLVYTRMMLSNRK